MHGDLDDDAQSNYLHRQYTVTDNCNLKSLVKETIYAHRLDTSGKTIQDIIDEIPWGAAAASLSWQFKGKYDTPVSNYLF